MCHGTIGSNLIKILSQPDQNYNTPIDYKVEGAKTNTLSYCTYIWLCGLYKFYIFIVAFGLNTSIKKEIISFVSIEYLMPI